MIVEVKNSEILSDFLRRTGRGMRADCTLHKGCGKCQVKLLSGLWESGGKTLLPPRYAVPCVTSLKSGTGTIELPDPAPAEGQFSCLWQHTSPLPSLADPLIAVDMGTTTLAAVRIEKGKIVKQAAAFNSQNIFGDNVIARIAAAENSLPQLHQKLRESTAALLEELNLSGVKRIAVAGNTVMNCFLHNIPPRSIGVFPFRAPQLTFPERRDLFGDIPVVTVPSLSGLLGGDIAGALHESPLEEGEMLLDLGTNCEIIFRSSSALWGSSAAAGPAFEGGGISCGSRAEKGAVDHYFGKGRFTVIGGSAPVSLCGSALADFLAVERAAGTLNAFGRFVSGESTFEIAPGLFITEEDIAELIKAKAAIAAAVRALELHAGEKVRQLKLAGGFSQYLNLDSARKIGLLPDLPVKVCGNLSLAGAARCAAVPESAETIAQTAQKIREVHLNDIPGFEELFTASLSIL